MRIKQSFTHFRKDGKVFGCSFKLAPNGQYFGWITEYPNRKAYNKLSTWTDWKNIPLDIEVNKSKDILLEYVKNIN